MAQLTKSNNHFHHYTKKDNIIRAVIVFILIVFGYLLLLLGEIPQLRYSSTMFWEFSDIVVFICYSLYGLWPSVFVSLFKIFLTVITIVPTSLYPLPVEYIALLISSLSVIFLFHTMDHFLKFFHKKIYIRVPCYLLFLSATALIMTALHYFYFTPMHFNNNHWCDVSMINTTQLVADHPEFFKGYNYLTAMFRIYTPYYAIKYCCIVIVYELFFHYFINRYLKSGFFNLSYFTNQTDFHVQYQILSFRKKSFENAKRKEILSKRIQILKRSNARKAYDDNETTEEIPQTIIYQDYLYRLHINNNGSITNVEIISDTDGASLIINFMKNSYPHISYKVTSYKENGEIITDASTDGLSPELFRQVNHYDQKNTKILDVDIMFIKKLIPVEQ